MQTSQPLLILVMALVLALDGTLQKPLRRHVFAAVACLPLFAWMLGTDAAFALTRLALFDWIVLGASLLGGALLVVLSPEPISYYDNAYTRLDRVRVNAGFVAGLLAGFQAIVTLGPVAWFETPIWACLVVVLLSFAVRRVLDWKAGIT